MTWQKEAPTQPGLWWKVETYGCGKCWQKPELQRIVLHQGELLAEAGVDLWPGLPLETSRGGRVRWWSESTREHIPPAAPAALDEAKA